MTLRKRTKPKGKPAAKPAEPKISITLAAADWKAIRDACLRQQVERKRGTSGNWNEGTNLRFLAEVARKITDRMAEAAGSEAFGVTAAEAGFVHLSRFLTSCMPVRGGVGSRYIALLSAAQHGPSKLGESPAERAAIAGEINRLREEGEI